MTEKACRVYFYPKGLDISRTIYRFFRLPRFEETLRAKRLTFVRPSAWEDPWDHPPVASLVYLNVSPHKCEMAKDCEESLYGQCWSAAPESDTLWRAYSRVKNNSSGDNIHSDDEGVQVSTTMEKMIAAFENSDAPKEWRLFIGEVTYHTEKEIEQYIANQVGTFGPRAFEKATDAAGLLLRKRLPFSNEVEVRLIIADPSNDASQANVSFSFDPNALFSNVTFDPRLVGQSPQKRKELAQSLGYAGRIESHMLYVGRMYEIGIE